MGQSQLAQPYWVLASNFSIGPSYGVLKQLPSFKIELFENYDEKFEFELRYSQGLHMLNKVPERNWKSWKHFNVGHGLWSTQYEVQLSPRLKHLKMKRLTKKKHQKSGIIVWKCHCFYTTQILGEISFGHSRSAKFAIWKHFEALHYDFYEFLHFLKAEFYQINKIQ